MKRKLTWLFQAQYRSQMRLQLLLIIQSRTLRWAILPTLNTLKLPRHLPFSCVYRAPLCPAAPCWQRRSSMPPWLRGGCKETRGNHQQRAKDASPCPSVSPAGILHSVAIAPAATHQQYVNVSCCAKTQENILDVTLKKNCLLLDRGILQSYKQYRAKESTWL